MEVQSIGDIKFEIISDLLFRYVQRLGKGYGDYFKISDCQIVDDCEIRIFLDTIYKKEDFHNCDMYKLYLKDYELKCKEFIIELDKELPLNNFIFDETFYDEDELDGEYYFSCALNFKIKKSEVYYY